MNEQEVNLITNILKDSAAIKEVSPSAQYAILIGKIRLYEYVLRVYTADMERVQRILKEQGHDTDYPFVRPLKE
jgi:hypothetical protein